MAIPSWLLHREVYDPPRDKDVFIDRSILAFLSLLSKARAKGPKEEGGRRVDAFFKILAMLIFLVLVSLSRSPAFLALVATIFLVLLALQSADRIRAILATSLSVLLFTTLILLPSALAGSPGQALVLLAKIFISVGTVKLVSVRTEWTSISGALRRLGVPDLFILVFDIALKYIALLGEFALSMLYALRLRSVGHNAGKRSALTGIGGTLFLKSREMEEEMYSAMECRGFSGEYRSASSLRFGAREAGLSLAMAALVLAFIVLRGAR